MGRDARIPRIVQGGPIDRVGHPIVEGGTVEYHSVLPPIFKIDTITIDMDPQRTAGLPRGVAGFKITGTGKLELFVIGNHPTQVLTMIGYPEPAGDQPPAEGNGHGDGTRTEQPRTAEAEGAAGAAPDTDGPRLVLTDSDRDSDPHD